MRDYEIGFIVTPEASDEDIKKIKESVLRIIQRGKGNVKKVDEWGRRKMAYPIKKHEEGYYIFIYTEADGKVVASVEKRLRQQERILRFISLRLDDKIKKMNRLKRKWKKDQRLAKISEEAPKKKEMEIENDVEDIDEEKEYADKE